MNSTLIRSIPSMIGCSSNSMTAREVADTYPPARRAIRPIPVWRAHAHRSRCLGHMTPSRCRDRHRESLQVCILTSLVLQPSPHIFQRAGCPRRRLRDRMCDRRLEATVRDPVGATSKLPPHDSRGSSIPGGQNQRPPTDPSSSRPDTSFIDGLTSRGVVGVSRQPAHIFTPGLRPAEWCTSRADYRVRRVVAG